MSLLPPQHLNITWAHCEISERVTQILVNLLRYKYSVAITLIVNIICGTINSTLESSLPKSQCLWVIFEFLEKVTQSSIYAIYFILLVKYSRIACYTYCVHSVFSFKIIYMTLNVFNGRLYFFFVFCIKKMKVHYYVTNFKIYSTTVYIYTRSDEKNATK